MDLTLTMNIPQLQFDAARYQRESGEVEMRKGKAAYYAGWHNEAVDHFRKAYLRGNVLAGVLLGICYYYERDYKAALPLFIGGMYRGYPLAADWLAELYRFGRNVPKDKDKALALHSAGREGLEEMCKAGSPDAQYMYGFNLLHGVYGAYDEQTALHWLQRSVEQGDIQSDIEIARMYLNGWGVDKDPDRGAQILSRYNSSSNRKAHYELGRLYYHGISVGQNYHIALSHFKKAAEQGYSTAQKFIGDIYYWGKGVPIDYTKARSYYESAASQGNRDAVACMGDIYYWGRNVSIDYTKARSYYESAAESGSAYAMRMLGNIYYDGKGGQANVNKAFEYYCKAADLGDANAICAVGNCYHLGKGVAIDYDKALEYYRKASDMGNARAQYAAGLYYLGDISDGKYINASLALEYLRKAAAGGNPGADYLLAREYSRGKIVEKDNTKAREHLRRAAEHGHKDAKAMLGRMAPYRRYGQAPATTRKKRIIVTGANHPSA